MAMSILSKLFSGWYSGAVKPVKQVCKPALILLLIMALLLPQLCFPPAPAAAQGPAATPMVSAGSYHSLALKDDGTAYAWGSNFSGQPGYGAAWITTPVQTLINMHV